MSASCRQGELCSLQLINLLTTKELNLALPKKAIKPCTFILKPGMSMLIGGVARLDYTEVRFLYGHNDRSIA